MRSIIDRSPAALFAAMPRIATMPPATTGRPLQMTARFKYACFVSYIHADEDLGRGFVSQFVQALQGELEQLVDLKSLPIYSDNILKPGQIWPEALSVALCHSLCMVMVYSPVYGRRAECLREFRAMEQIEARRRQLLAGDGASAAEGFIIPVVLRGFDRMPSMLKSTRHAVDFSRFTLADVELKRNPRFTDAVRAIAERISDVLETLEPLQDKACKGCDDFQLPDPDRLQPLMSAGANWQPGFPGR